MAVAMGSSLRFLQRKKWANKKGAALAIGPQGDAAQTAPGDDEALLEALAAREGVDVELFEARWERLGEVGDNVVPARWELIDIKTELSLIARHASSLKRAGRRVGAPPETSLRAFKPPCRREAARKLCGRDPTSRPRGRPTRSRSPSTYH